MTLRPSKHEIATPRYVCDRGPHHTKDAACAGTIKFFVRLSVSPYPPSFPRLLMLAAVFNARAMRVVCATLCRGNDAK